MIATESSVLTWYPTLVKPSWNPPDWVFGPVWSFLYLTLALAGAYLTKLPASSQKQAALTLFFVQLFFNFLWSPLFFGLRNPLMAFGDILLLWISIVVLLKVLFSLERKVFYLLLPYFLWVSYAVSLNAAIVWLN